MNAGVWLVALLLLLSAAYGALWWIVLRRARHRGDPNFLPAWLGFLPFAGLLGALVADAVAKRKASPGGTPSKER